MTQEQRKIIEDKAFARFGSSYASELKRMKNEIFVSGAEAMDEILQKEIAELKQVMAKLIGE